MSTGPASQVFTVRSAVTQDQPDHAYVLPSPNYLPNSPRPTLTHLSRFSQYQDNVVGPGSPKYDNAFFEINYVRAYTTSTAPSSSAQPTPTDGADSVTTLAGGSATVTTVIVETTGGVSGRTGGAQPTTLSEPGGVRRVGVVGSGVGRVVFGLMTVMTLVCVL